jgi:hypothetical protein
MTQYVSIKALCERTTLVSAGLKGGHFSRNKSLPSLEKKICEDAVKNSIDISLGLKFIYDHMS